MMQQLGVPFYPALIVVADVVLAAVLLLVAPVLGVLMTVVALSLAAALVLRARGHVAFAPRPEVSRDG